MAVKGSDYIWRYEPDDIQAVLDVHSADTSSLRYDLGDLWDPDFPMHRSFLRVELGHRRDGSISKAVKERKWKPPRPRNWMDLRDWMRDDNHIVGWIPAHALMAVVDVDVDRSGAQTIEDRTRMVMDAVGRPMVGCPARSGGYHLYYAIRNTDEAQAIRAGNQKIGGVHFGEIACLHRMINIWQPLTLRKAFNRRISGKGLRFLDISALDAPAPQSPTSNWSPSGRAKFSAEEIADALGLRWSDKEQMYRGACPICGTGGTHSRFELKQWRGDVSAYCWGCLGGDKGAKWTPEQWSAILKPVYAKRDAANEVMLGGILKPL